MKFSSNQLSVIDEETGLRIDISTNKYKHINIDGDHFEEIIKMMRILLEDFKENSELLGKIGQYSLTLNTGADCDFYTNADDSHTGVNLTS